MKFSLCFFVLEPQNNNLNDNTSFSAILCQCKKTITSRACLKLLKRILTSQIIIHSNDKGGASKKCRSSNYWLERKAQGRFNFGIRFRFVFSVSHETASIVLWYSYHYAPFRGNLPDPWGVNSSWRFFLKIYSETGPFTSCRHLYTSHLEIKEVVVEQPLIISRISFYLQKRNFRTLEESKLSTD